MAGFWRRRNAQLCRTVLTTRPSRHAEHQRGRHRRGWSCGCRPLRTADPGGTSHQGVWIAPFAAAQARLRLRRRAAAGAIPSILNVVMPTQVALPLSQPVTRPAARLLPSRLRVLPSPTPPYGDNADSVTPLVLRRPSSNLQIRRLRQVVQDRPLRSVRWADIPQLSVSDRRCLAAWQQHWQQSRLYDFDSRPSGSSKLVDHP